MTIMAKQSSVRKVLFIDAFAGAGIAEDRDSGKILEGSAARAAEITPPFDELHFIERDAAKADFLAQMMERDDRVRVHRGDAEQVLRASILPRCRYEDYARALCLLDPYGLSVSWQLLAEIGHMRSVEIFFNFMVMGANRNVLWDDPSRVSPRRLELMDRCWPDRKTWQEAAYKRAPTPSLFDTDRLRKGSNEQLVEAYRTCLRDHAGFKFVPPPIPMRNTRNAVVYYLFFATHNATGDKIVRSIFNKHRGQS